MADTQRTNGTTTLKFRELFKEPIEAAHVRLGQIEEEAHRVWKDLLLKGRASRKDMEQIFLRFAKQGRALPEVRHLLERLREQGAERAAEWRGKAESFRAEALERMLELQGKAVAFLGVATREQVEELSRELGRLERRIEHGQKARRPARKGPKPSEQV
ncbi:MAG TPA: hypothetical protein VMU15_07530 [Anaeromyxobacter sp.]|nr:hypothetical protein [Anaeromyxobacter sp.]